jgi:biotin carboxyl carrier protein
VTHSYPQAPQQQPSGGGRPNRIALWVNTRKQAPNQPDYKGNVEITWDLLQEMLAAFNAGQYTTDYGQRPCIKLDVAVYAQPPADKKPVMSGQLSTVAETAQSAALREQARAQNGYQQQAPQGYAPAPQQAYQQPPQQPAPMPQQPAPVAAPAPVYQPPQQQMPMPVAQPMPGAIHGQPPAQPVAQVPPGF